MKINDTVNNSKFLIKCHVRLLTCIDNKNSEEWGGED